MALALVLALDRCHVAINVHPGSCSVGIIAPYRCAITSTPHTLSCMSYSQWPREPDWDVLAVNDWLCEGNSKNI